MKLAVLGPLEDGVVLVVRSWYSWWEQVILGGVRALSNSRCQTGGIDGNFAPFAISDMVFKNWTIPNASQIVWLRRKAKMKPLQLSLVT